MIGLACRFYQSSSAEMSGAAPPPQNEQKPSYRSPYGAARVYRCWVTRNYREAYGMFAINPILLNHENPRRGETFVTRKITRAVAWIEGGLQDDLYLGNLDFVRDWGNSREFVEAMWLRLQDDEPRDYVVATATAYSVREFVQFAFDHAELDWERHVRFDNGCLRPNGVDALIRDAFLARRTLGWVPVVQTPELARIMVDADILTLKTEVAPWMHRTWAHG